MLTEDKSLKDPERKPMASYRAGSINTSTSLSYTKTDKLITALYMVTDIMDGGEPIKNKLRTLGVEILSDIHSIHKDNNGHIANNAMGRIGELLSFLDIAGAVNILSEMNSSILKKEFIQLHRSIQESIYNIEKPRPEINLSEFLKDENTIPPMSLGPLPLHRGGENPTPYTSIGIQKGSTLMKALSDKTSTLSNKNISLQKDSPDFDFLKKERRFKIVKIIKNRPEGVSIKDIKLDINQGTQDGVIYSEKTIQRELLSMIKDGVLYKTGEKRWSMYFIKN